MKNLKEAEKAAVQLFADYCWSHDPESDLKGIDERVLSERAKEINETLIKFKEHEQDH